MSGTARPRIVTAQPGPGAIHPATLAEARESFLYVDPVWLAATDHALPGMTPFHTVARRRDDEHAVLPAYLVTDPALPDVDPLTYLQAGPVAPGQCGTGGCGAIEGIVAADLLPAIVIGSPLGFHTEPFFTFWNERLLPDMVAATLDAARDVGAKSVLAPWMSQRLTGVDLGGELRRAGAAQTFWGSDEYIPLSAASAEAHLAGIPRKQRQRLTGDARRLSETVALRTLTGSDLGEVLPPLATLIAATYQRHGTPLTADALLAACTALLPTSDMRAICAFTPDDGRLLGGHILFYRHPRLYAKWVGVDTDVAGTGLYFALVIEAAIALGYELGALSLELGAGAYEAKRLRGSLSRVKNTALLAFDPAVLSACLPLFTEFGRSRRAAQNSTTSPLSDLELAAADSGGPNGAPCCSD
ncbi:MAG: GNAT family N-acetyltransferase [Pseudonocardiaceae bacterium]